MDRQAARNELEGSYNIPAAVVLILLGLAAFIGKLPHLPTSEPFSRILSLENLPAEVSEQVLGVMLVPLGALVVVFVRLTLGIRTLGPFRPILIAIGLQGAGVAVGLAFFVTVLVTIVALRPRLSGRWLPYYGRLSILLATVVLLELVVVGLGREMELAPMQRTAFFPIVVLCLAADGFARVIAQEGMRPALQRGGATLLTAVAIYLISSIPGLRELFLRFPELLLWEIAGIFLIAGLLSFRLFERINTIELPEEQSGT